MGISAEEIEKGLGVDERVNGLDLDKSLKEIERVSFEIENLEMQAEENEKMEVMEEMKEFLPTEEEKKETELERKKDLKILGELRRKLIFHASGILYKEYEAGIKEYKKTGEMPEVMTNKQAFLLVQFFRSRINYYYGSEIRPMPDWKQQRETAAIDELHRLEHYSSERPLSRAEQNQTLYDYGYIDTEEYLKEKNEIEKMAQEAAS